MWCKKTLSMKACSAKVLKTITKAGANPLFSKPFHFHDSFFFLNRLYLRAILVSQQNWTEATEIGYRSFPPTPTPQSPHYENAAPERYICYRRWPCIDPSSSSLSVIYVRVHSQCCTFWGFWQVYNIHH